MWICDRCGQGIKDEETQGESAKYEYIVAYNTYKQIEFLMSLHDKTSERVAQGLNTMLWRVRINGQRDIRGYKIASSAEVTWDIAETEEFRRLVQDEGKHQGRLF